MVPSLRAAALFFAGLCLAALLVQACFDFDSDHAQYCLRSGQCDGGAGGGGGGAGGGGGGGGADGGGGGGGGYGLDGAVDAGTDGGVDAGTDGGVDPEPDGGADGGRDGGPDGGPDAGCRALAAVCSADVQCCSGQCLRGGCAPPNACSAHDAGCADPTDCCDGLGCAATLSPVRCQGVSITGRFEEGWLCAFHDQCSRGHCDNGVCREPLSCAGVRMSCQMQPCCSDAGVCTRAERCRLKDGERCVDSFACLSARCPDAGFCADAG